MPSIHETPIRQYNQADAIELAQDIEISRREIAKGKGIPHEQVMSEMDALINRLAVKEKQIFTLSKKPL